MSNSLVVGLGEGDSGAITRIMAIAHLTSRDSFSRRGRPVRLDPTELTSIAVLDALTAIRNGSITEDSELIQSVKRSVWREVKRQQRIDVKRATREEFEAAIENLQTEHPAEQVYELPPPSVDVLYREAKSANEEQQARLDLVAVDAELVTYLARHPEQMYTMSPRRFEELIATVLSDMGYQVELTGFGADGGVDIVASQKSGVGDTLLLVDCKRYAADRPVGVSIVRALFGITEQRRATTGVLATTSFFTSPAQEFRSAVRHRLALKDYSDLQIWLNNYGHARRA